MRIVRHRPPLVVWAAVAASVGAPLWIESVAPARWSEALSFEPSFAGLLVMTAAVAGTIRGVRPLWGLHCVLVAAAAAFTGSAALTQADAQAIGGFVLALTSLVLLILPPVVRYEDRRLSALIIG